MFLAIFVVAGLDLPEAPLPPEVTLRGKSVAPEVFRAQAKRIVAPLEPTQTTVASYAEGAIDKIFSDALQLSVAVAGKSKFLVPVDFSKLPGSGNGVGDTIRVYGVVRNSKLYAYWWEYWLPGLELSGKAAARLDADGSRTVVGKASNNGSRAIDDLKVEVMLYGSKTRGLFKKVIAVGTLDPGESKEFDALFELVDAESRKATNVVVRVSSYRKSEIQPKSAPKSKSEKNDRRTPGG